MASYCEMINPGKERREWKVIFVSVSASDENVLLDLICESKLLIKQVFLLEWDWQAQVPP